MKYMWLTGTTGEKMSDIYFYLCAVKNLTILRSNKEGNGQQNKESSSTINREP